jgi:hypothetical protein
MTRSWAVLALSLSLIACKKTPRCATQDCASGKIVDDGCVDDGKGGRICVACVNPCPPP